MKWVTATHLDAWSETRSAQETLAEVVRRAIWATVPVSMLREINFPAGDSVGQPGWDGILESALESPFVPARVSAWEFGTGKDPGEKASDDFRKRIKDSLGLDPKQVTFVFVTSRRWSGRSKAAWLKRRRAKAFWADVRVIDGDLLEQWLEQAPAVAAWLAKRVLQTFPADVESLEDFWAAYRTSTRPPITADLLLAGREAQANELVSLLMAAPQAIVIRSDSSRESLAFAAAAVERAGEGRLGLVARAIVATDARMAQQLASHTGLIIAVNSGADQVGGLLVSRQNHVLVPVGNEHPNYKVTFNLFRPPRQTFAKALAETGLPEDEAERLARECGRSVTILQRRRPAAGVNPPEWARDDKPRTLIPALLAGGWDENSSADRQILEQLAGRSYPDLAASLQRWTLVSDPPLRRAGSVWTLAAPADAFTLLTPHLIGSDYKRLAVAGEAVLGEIDPALDLPPDDRPFAAIHDKVLKHSRWLRVGLAESLSWLSAAGKNVANDGFHDPESFVSTFVRRLLESSADWRRWASLSAQLPTLAEAAPDPFVEVLEQRLDKRPEDIREMFSEGGVFTSSPHTGLLWALETLAWSPCYLLRVSLLLARLAKLDPGGKLLNRPINTLREIYLPWHPNTYVRAEMRLRALDAILQAEPEIGWELLVKLLPESHGVAHETAKPRWRDFGASEAEILTTTGYFAAQREITRRALDRVGSDARRWQVLLASVHELPPPDRERALTLLEGFAGLAVPTADREAVWKALVDLINRHRSFQDSEWALPERELDRWEALAQRLVPDDVVRRHLWLFDSHVPDLPSKLDDVRERMEEVAVRRADAIREVLDREGVNGIVRLVDAAQYPTLIAWSFPVADAALELVDRLYDATAKGGDQRGQFAAALSARTWAVLGEQWRDHVLARFRGEGWTSDDIALALRAWLDDPGVWRAVASLGADVERAYWSAKFVYPVEGPAESLADAIRRYLAVGRAGDALDVASFRAKDVPGPLLLEVLDALVQQLSAGNIGPMPGNVQYKLQRAFEALYAATDVDELEVAKREYAFLPLLVGPQQTGPLQLHRLLSRDPAFFVSVLVDVYKPASGEAPESGSELVRRRAETGYRLLNSWRYIPGTDETGRIDAGKLLAWIEAARKLAKEQDRAVVGDHVIGHMLAHAPADPDGAWPHAAIRQVIETVRSSDIEYGIRLESFNKRGVHWRAPGGQQERELAEQARQWAAKVQSEWPRTYALLDRIARMWDEQAKQEDERSQQEALRE